MPSCAIITCRNYVKKSNTNKGVVSYHKFPKEPHIRNEWIKATGRLNWTPSPTSTICSAHFCERDYNIKKSGNRYLKSGSIPTLNIEHNTYPDLSASNHVLYGFMQNDDFNSSTTEQQNNTCIQMVVNTGLIPPLEATSPPSGIDASLTEQNIMFSKDGVLIASKPIKKKRKLVNSESTTGSIIEKQRIRIIKMKAENRRLREKEKIMGDILKSIQDKFDIKDEDLLNIWNTNEQVREILSNMIKSRSAKPTEMYWPPLLTF